MKQLKTVVEVEDEGFVSLLGKQVEIGTPVFIYTGILIGVNDTFIKLEDPAIVFQTGPLTADKYENAQHCYKDKTIPKYIQLSGIIEFGISVKKY